MASIEYVDAEVGKSILYVNTEVGKLQSTWNVKMNAMDSSFALNIAECESKVREMDDAKEALDKAQVDVRKRIENIEDMLKEYMNKEKVEALIKEITYKEKDDEKAKDKKPVAMTSRRDFSFLPKYAGKHEDFDEWKFKMSTFLSEENEFKELLLKLDKLKEVPEDFEVNDVLNQIDEMCGKKGNQEWINHQLYQVLCMNLEGKALSMIKNLKEQAKTNGVLGWCKLIQDCSSMTSQRLQ